MAIQMSDPAKAQRMNIAVNIWTARTIPVILAGIVGYATYVLVVVLCVHYLLVKHNDISAAIPILVVYFVLFLLMASSFFRLFYITTFDPPLVPLGPTAILKNGSRSRDGNKGGRGDGIGGGEYDSRESSGDTSRNAAQPQRDPDSPGLELFYTKEVFSCENDGKPKWCSHCANWKPDRAHHCSMNGRCILRMDHFCPWVGGPIGENNMKFFVQFTTYTALYCLHLLVVMAIYVAKQRSSRDEKLNAQFAVILGLAAFFFSFTAGMAGGTINDAIWNMTQVERLGAKTKIHTLAVLKPSHDRLCQINPAIAISQSWNQLEVTYPLNTGTEPLGRSEERGVPPPEATSKGGQGRPSQVAPKATSALQPLNGPSLSEPPTVVGQSDVLASSPIVPSAQQQSGHHSYAPGNLEATPRLPTAASGGLQHLADRDLRATRVFAVLQTPDVGQNPWDLGSALLNFKYLMGNNIIDWILPIRRSPCCNHESTESYYALGPFVENMKQIAGFVEVDKERDEMDSNPRQRRRKDKEQKSRSDGDQTADDIHPNGDVEMNKLKNSRPQRSTGEEGSADYVDERS